MVKKRVHPNQTTRQECTCESLRHPPSFGASYGAFGLQPLERVELSLAEHPAPIGGGPLRNWSKAKVPNGKTVLLAYYEGAYGPTLRIDTQSLDGLAEIREIVRKLSTGEAQEVSLHQLPFVLITPPLESVILKVLTDKEGTTLGPKRIKRQIGQGNLTTLEWMQSSAEWTTRLPHRRTV